MAAGGAVELEPRPLGERRGQRESPAARVWAVAVVQAARARVVRQEAQGPLGVPEQAGGPAWAVLERADPPEAPVAQVPEARPARPDREARAPAARLGPVGRPRRARDQRQQERPTPSMQPV